MAADLTPRQRERLRHFKQQGRVAYYRNGRLHVENGHSRTSEENTSRYNSNNRSDQEGSSVTRDQRYVRHADHKDERKGIYTDDHHQPTTRIRHHDEDHRKQQTTVSGQHQKERTPSDRHESNGGRHRDSQKCTQANHPNHLRPLGPSKSPTTTTAGDYSQELRELRDATHLGEQNSAGSTRRSTATWRSM